MEIELLEELDESNRKEEIRKILKEHDKELVDTISDAIELFR